MDCMEPRRSDGIRVNGKLIARVIEVGEGWKHTKKNVLKIDRSDAIKFYLSSAWTNKSGASYWIELLTAQGWQVTHNWTVEDDTDFEDELCKIAEIEIDAVKKADIVIVVLPGGKGTHTEMGAALAVGHPVVVIGDITSDEYLCPFYFHPMVVQLGDGIL